MAILYTYDVQVRRITVQVIASSVLKEIVQFHGVVLVNLVFGTRTVSYLLYRPGIIQLDGSEWCDRTMLYVIFSLQFATQYILRLALLLRL